MGTAECRLYVLTNKDTTKIGITIRSVKERMQQINRNSGKGFKEQFSLLLDNSRTARGLEQAMLKCLRSRYRQPIEVFDGSTESFYDVDLSSLVAQITERSIILTDNPEVLIIENN